MGITPAEVTTDPAPAYPRVLEEYVPAALHTDEQYAINPIEANHHSLKSLAASNAWPETLPVGANPCGRNAFVQNMRHGRFETATGELAHDRLRVSFDEIATRA